MRHLQGSRRDGKRERGQILVLFELVLIVILGFSAMVIDLGVLRNNRQILVNTLDAAALAGGSVLPVKGPTEAQAAEDLITANIAVNYPSLVLNTDYWITYSCLIGADVVTGAPMISRDIPSMCDPHNKLGHTPPVAGDFSGAGKTRVSACDPKLGDMCNVVVITGSSTTKYVLAPVLGVSSGSSGTVVSAACKGGCGASTVVPVDLVIILDRTGSMSGNDSSGHNKIASLKTAAKAVLGVYDPAKQRVALALTGPGTVNAAGNPTLDSSCPSGAAYGTADDDNFAPTTTLSGGSTTLGSAATTVNAPKTNLGGPLTQITVAMTTSGSNNTITVPAGGKTGFPAGTGWAILVDNEQMTVTANPSSTTWTVTRTARVAHSVNAPVSTPNYITATDSPITVTSKVGFPTAFPFWISIDSEQMRVDSSPTGTTWAVTRHQGGTTAAAHSSGETAILLITATSTALPVTSAAGFPTSGSYTIKVNTEQMTVTGGQGTTLWTVQRGQGGTTAAAQANGAAVSWDIDKDDTTIYVASEAAFPTPSTSDPFTIKIDSEEMLVTAAPTGTTWTVTRGQGGTTAAAHAGGAAVNMVVGTADTTIRVASAIGFPATGNYTIQVDSERMQVSSVSGTTTPTTIMHVTRGVSGGGGAAKHTSGKTVTNWTSWDPSTYSPSDPSSNTNGVWVPVGLSGTDTTDPQPNPTGAAATYEVAGTANPSSTIVKAINCIQDSSNGTTLSMPLAYAKWYLDTYGRPGVTKGILLETDGHPQDGGNFASGLNMPQFTCTAAIAAASAAKAEGIKVYAVGYGISGTCGGDSPHNSSETKTGMTAKQLLQTVATGTAAPYYFDSPAGDQLASYFQQIAVDLAHGGTHLIQLYPPPVVTGVGSGSISGQYFTGVTSVTFGGASLPPASVHFVGDTSITVTLPSGLVHGQHYQFVVTTPGGSSVMTSASDYTYP